VSGDARSELARLLRQRAEMGQGPVFLDELARGEALALAARAAPAGRDLHEGPSAPSPRPQAGANVGRGRTDVAPAPAQSPPVRPAAPAVREVATSARASGPASLPVLGADLEALRAEAASCTRCRLHTGRTHPVFADGNPNARLMVVGEAPGANEDATGLPFVGQAGKLLDLMLASVGLSRRESVYICNVIKCRPPGNRNPAPDEIAMCSPFLRRQIELVKPEALLAVGSFSAQLLTGTEKPIGKLRGEVYSYEGVPLVITYHPAALLRNPGWSRAAWDDLQLLRQVMEGR
jgi:uracil-DNA glycosylase family 4